MTSPSSSASYAQRHAPPASVEPRLQRVPDVASTVIDNELILMDLRSGKYFCFSGTARRIWQMLESPITCGELCEALRERYEVDAATCRRDVERFLAVLAERQLVSRQA